MATTLLEELKKDHTQVKEILKQLVGTSDRAEKSRRTLLEKLAHELKPHLKAEEKVFYPALAEKKELREKAFEAFEEHHVAETVLRELVQLDATSERWKAKAKVLKEIIEHHIEEEENEIFPLVQEDLGQAWIQDLYPKFAEVKKATQKKIS